MSNPTIYKTEAYTFDTITGALDFIQRNKRKKGVKSITFECADDEGSTVCLVYDVEKLDSA